jgi:signal transduction histidine kinase
MVNLRKISLPDDGFLVATPKTCRSNFAKGPECRKHYEKMLASSTIQNAPVQCPFGFTSFPFEAGTEAYCITSLIPFPRHGGEIERKLAKAHPSNKIALEQLNLIVAKLQEAEQLFLSLAADIVERQSMALHEIRKLNRNIKHEAERLCAAQSPSDPDLADPSLVKIWKSSELMSRQFDVIEILANEQHLKLPLNWVSEIYRLFDKCVRIYRPEGKPERLQIHAPYGFKSKIRACEKTFHLIPTILIENALKYSLADTPIDIEFSREQGMIYVSATNVYVGANILTDAIFKKGIRETKTLKEGTGNGLYVASLVARQHNAKLTVKTEPIGSYKMECTFTLAIPEVLD